MYVLGNNIDYNSTTQTVTIIAGTNNSTVNVTVTDDNIVEGNETFSMFLTLPSSLGPRIMTGDITSATGIIIDTSGKYLIIIIILMTSVALILNFVDISVKVSPLFYTQHKPDNTLNILKKLAIKCFNKAHPL